MNDDYEKIETNFYDKEELYDDCVVQVLTNTITGETSVGWWKNNGWNELTEKRTQTPAYKEVIAYSSVSHRQMIGEVYWDEDCDCYTCEDNDGGLMFDVTHWRVTLLPPDYNNNEEVN